MKTFFAVPLCIGAGLIALGVYKHYIRMQSKGTMGHKYWSKWENVIACGILLVMLGVVLFFFRGLIL